MVYHGNLWESMGISWEFLVFNRVTHRADFERESDKMLCLKGL
jgi:hypothetical protein